MCIKLGFVAGSPAPKLLQSYQSRTEMSYAKNIHNNTFSQNRQKNKNNQPGTEKWYSYYKVVSRKSYERTYGGSNF